MAKEQTQSQATFSGANNQGLQMGQNMGTVNATFSSTVYMSGSPSAEDQFLDALMDGDTSLGVQIEAPEAGTCTWILSELQAWHTGPPTRPMCIHGSPGSGKSVMASFILRERKRWLASGPKEGATADQEERERTIVAGSFCDRHPSRQRPIWILRTLLYEIFRQNRDLIDTKDPEFWQASSNDAEQHPILNSDAFESTESLAKLLATIAAHEKVRELYLIVDGQYQQSRDALDLFDLVNQVASYGGDNALPRWIFSTRPNGLERLMNNVQAVDLSTKNRDDIKIAAMVQMKRFQRLNPGLTDSLVDEVVEILTQRAEGMFLWLSLALKSLGDGTIWDINEVKKKLQDMPYDVQTIYGSIHDHLDQRMQTLLRWAYVAGRPLKVNEVPVMWALQDGAKSLEEVTKKSVDPAQVRISLEGSVKALLALHDDREIHLAHPSVKDFIGHLYDNPGQKKRGISLAQTHRQVAEACLAYLNLDAIQGLEVPEPPVDENGMIDGEKRQEEINRYLGKYPFLEYSITFLGLHLRESETGDDVHLHVRGMEEFSGGKSKALQQWVRGYDLLVRCTAGKYTGGTSSLSLLFISARLNLTSLAERFVSTGSALTSLVNLPGTKALAGGASSWGMVRQQVVNLPDMKGWRALHVAADSEAEDVVVWLLENGAAVDAETMGFVRPGRTALHFAASKSTETAARIVRKLLESGANPGAPTRFGGNTPLHYAVRGGSEDILKTLLQHRSKHKPADPNVPNYSGITALHKAAGVAGWHKPVDLLLEYGANPEQAASLDKVAVARGVKDVKVASTLKAVASMKTATMWKSATDTFRGVATEHTALHIAVRAKGTEETVKRLLAWYTANDKMIESRDSMGYVPLHSAVEGSPTYTRLLLESKKVDVNVRDNEGRTPLMLYLRRLGRPQPTASVDDLVALKGTLDDLLAAGATPDTQDNDGKSVLDYATQAGQTWAVDKLRSILPPLESPKVASTPASPQGMAGKASNLMGGKFAMFSKK